MHSTIKTGNPSIPASIFTTCPTALNSETMYRNSVTSVIKLRNNAAASPYRCLVHSVKTNPCGHFFLMIGPSHAKANRGSAELRA